MRMNAVFIPGLKSDDTPGDLDLVSINFRSKEEMTSKLGELLWSAEYSQGIHEHEFLLRTSTPHAKGILLLPKMIELGSAPNPVAELFLRDQTDSSQSRNFLIHGNALLVGPKDLNEYYTHAHQYFLANVRGCAEMDVRSQHSRYRNVMAEYGY